MATLRFPSGPSPGLLKDSSDILIQPILIDFILNLPAVTFPFSKGAEKARMPAVILTWKATKIAKLRSN
jgi:hypothetical protein